MSAWFLRAPKKGKRSWGDRFVTWLENLYVPLLSVALKRGKWIVTAAVALLVVAVFTFSRMGGEFVPQLDEGDIAFHAILKPGSSLSEMIETTTRIEATVKQEFPEVQKIVAGLAWPKCPPILCRWTLPTSL